MIQDRGQDAPRIGRRAFMGDWHPSRACCRSRDRVGASTLAAGVPATKPDRPFWLRAARSPPSTADSLPIRCRRFVSRLTVGRGPIVQCPGDPAARSRSCTSAGRMIPAQRAGLAGELTLWTPDSSPSSAPSRRPRVSRPHSRSSSSISRQRIAARLALDRRPGPKSLHRPTRRHPRLHRTIATISRLGSVAAAPRQALEGRASTARGGLPVGRQDGRTCPKRHR